MATSISSERSGHAFSSSLVHSGGGMGDDLTRWDQAGDRLVASLDLSGVCAISSASCSSSSGVSIEEVETKTESVPLSQKKEVTPTQVSCDSAGAATVAATQECKDTPTT
eukprot:4963800-Amphidinium_carterae.1